VQVTVKEPDVLLKSVTTSPAENVASGIVIPADSEITLPTSLVATVVVVELIGAFKNPSVKLLDKSGSEAVTELAVFAD
jgi:hypothetical protein